MRLLQHHHRAMVRFLVVLGVAATTLATTTLASDAAGASSTRTKLSSSSLSVQHLVLQESMNKWWSDRWKKARDIVDLEQLVEDYNGDYSATAGSHAQACRHRRLIALPLQDAFDPPMGVFSHGHVQTGDKISLPQNFWTAIALNKAEVPWLFQVSRIPESTDETDANSPPHLVTPPRVEFITNHKDKDNKDDDVITEYIPANPNGLTKVVAGPLDFRAPPSYVFLPWWIMRALGIRPGEVVQVDLITTTPPGSLAKLRPHSKLFAQRISNPQAVLETELRHYSSLTKGTTIAMDYNGQRYWFDVVDCKSAPKGQSVPCIKVQDCDIATDFLTDRETVREVARKKKQKLQQQMDLE